MNIGQVLSLIVIVVIGVPSILLLLGSIIHAVMAKLHYNNAYMRFWCEKLDWHCVDEIDKDGYGTCWVCGKGHLLLDSQGNWF